MFQVCPALGLCTEHRNEPLGDVKEDASTGPESPADVTKGIVAESSLERQKPKDSNKKPLGMTTDELDDIAMDEAISANKSEKAYEHVR